MYSFRPDRIEYHISARLKKMAILLNQDCLKPSLKEMPYPAMSLIESLRIDTVQLPHAFRKISIGCINEQMVMIVHQAVSVAEPIVSKGNIRKGIQEKRSILIVSENCLSFVSSTRNVIDSTWKFYTQRTCHGYPIPQY
jgi:hypothetical protein